MNIHSNEGNALTVVVILLIFLLSFTAFFVYDQMQGTISSSVKLGESQYNNIMKSIHSLTINREEGTVSTVTASWKSGGKTITVKTTRLEGESAKDWSSRHAAEVAATEVDFPVDP